MTAARMKRNRLIKAEIVELIAKGYSLKEALYAVADKWYLSRKMVEKIYYDTRLS